MAIARYLCNFKFITSPCAGSRLHDLLQFLSCLQVLLVNGVFDVGPQEVVEGYEICL